MNYLGMQLGTDLSTSQVEYSFIGTGFVFAEQKLLPPSAVIFAIIREKINKTPKNINIQPRILVILNSDGQYYITAVTFTQKAEIV